MKIHLVIDCKNLMQASNFFKLYKVKILHPNRVPTTYVSGMGRRMSMRGLTGHKPVIPYLTIRKLINLCCCFYL